MAGGDFLGADVAADRPLFDVLSALSSCENKWAFEKISVAAELWEAWFERDAAAGGDVIVDCGNNALAEIALRLGCSKTVAENYAMLGIDLRLRLPKVRAAFAAGELDYSRAARISRSTCGFTAKTVELAEPGIIAAARSLSPGPLGAAIDRILIAIAPDEVEQRRIDATQARRVRKRRDGDLGVFEAVLAPDECETSWQRVEEVAATVCKHDQRNRQYRLVDAFMALMHGEDRLGCLCGRADCAAAARPVPGRRKPLVQIAVDVATLAGLASRPAYLEGYGPIDPALARELAADATWQAMLTESREMADELGLLATSPEQRVCVALPRGRGLRRKAGRVPAVSDRGPFQQPSADSGRSDDHVDLPGALEYKPDAETVAIVRARDRHCRFPGCRVPARQCQLDHVIPFSHHNPHAGGRTVPSNLQCLCAFHHQLKTLKLWSAQLRADGAVVWINSYGTSHVTVADGGLNALPPAPDLRPTVRSGPVAWRPPEVDQGPPPF